MLSCKTGQCGFWVGNLLVFDWGRIIGGLRRIVAIARQIYFFEITNCDLKWLGELFDVFYKKTLSCHQVYRMKKFYQLKKSQVEVADFPTLNSKVKVSDSDEMHGHVWNGSLAFGGLAECFFLMM